MCLLLFLLGTELAVPWSSNKPRLEAIAAGAVAGGTPVGAAGPAAGVADPAAGVADPAAREADPAARVADPAAGEACPATAAEARWGRTDTAVELP